VRFNNEVLEAFQRLNDDDGGEVNVVEESSIMDCIMPEGGLDVGKFLHWQNLLSLFEMIILKEAGVIDNGCSPTGYVASRKRLIAVRRNSRSMLYEVWDGESRRPAKPIDSYWWKMYVAHPMINVPKFHKCFQHIFCMHYVIKTLDLQVATL
jgi:hypothetical protein